MGSINVCHAIPKEKFEKYPSRFAFSIARSGIDFISSGSSVVVFTRRMPFNHFQGGLSSPIVIRGRNRFVENRFRRRVAQHADICYNDGKVAIFRAFSFIIRIV